MNMLIGNSILVSLFVGFIFLVIKDNKYLWNKLVLITTIILFITLYLFNYNLNDSAYIINLFSNFGISFKINEFNVIYGFITVFAWLIAVVLSKEYFKKEDNLKYFYGFLLITLAGTLGVFYANDLFTLFIFFEIMSFSSYLWVVYKRDNDSIIASKNYLAYTVFGGLMLLMGIFILSNLINDLTIDNLVTNIKLVKNNSLLVLSSILMLIGFGCKAGLFFFHDWVARSYKAAPAPATSLLSGILTKTGIYGIIIVSFKIMANNQEFIYAILILSMLNMLVCGLYAFLSNDLKTTLAYSSVSQIGFILWGVALSVLLKEHNTYAIYGTIFHIINHTLIKTLLFSLSGIIYKDTNTTSLKELVGYGKDKPWLKYTFLIGALAIMGVPLFSGYISKTLLHEAMVEMIHYNIGNNTFNIIFEQLFLLAGGFTFAYILKLYLCLFYYDGKKYPSNKNYISKEIKVLLSIVAISLVILGVIPNITFDKIGGYMAHYFNTHHLDNIHYFIFANIKGSVISIWIGLGLYFIVMKNTVLKNMNYNDYNSSNITLERYLYFPVISVIHLLISLIFRIIDVSLDIIIIVVNRLFYKSSKIPASFFVGNEKGFYVKDRGKHITHSLAYSLLMFGVGLIITIVYLIVVGSN